MYQLIIPMSEITRRIWQKVYPFDKIKRNQSTRLYNLRAMPYVMLNGGDAPILAMLDQMSKSAVASRIHTNEMCPPPDIGNIGPHPAHVCAHHCTYNSHITGQQLTGTPEQRALYDFVVSLAGEGILKPMLSDDIDDTEQTYVCDVFEAKVRRLLQDQA